MHTKATQLSPARAPVMAKGPAPTNGAGSGWSVEPGGPLSPRTCPYCRAADLWLAHLGFLWLGRKWKTKSNPSPARESYLVVDPELLRLGGAVVVVSVLQVPDVTRYRDKQPGLWHWHAVRCRARLQRDRFRERLPRSRIVRSTPN